MRKKRKKNSAILCLEIRNIWTMLGQNPRQRVIAVGEHPDMLLFPCSVQSYGDIAGSWGNPMVVADEEKFREVRRPKDGLCLYTSSLYVSVGRPISIFV